MNGLEKSAGQDLSCGANGSLNSSHGLRKHNLQHFFFTTKEELKH